VKVVRDRPEARLLPSRNRLAAFRLIAFVRATVSRPRGGQRRSIVVLDRDQSTFENYTVSVVVLGVWSAYFSYLVPLLAAVSPLVMGIVLQVPIYVTGLLLPKGRENHRVQSRVMFALLIAASLWFATRVPWVRFVADGFLLLVAVNAIAALILLPLRGRVSELEREWAQC
jgi:hypothetical protein